MAVAEALQYGLERKPGVVEGVAAGEQRAQHVDQNDLPRVVPEVLDVEPGDRLALVDVETLRHQRAQRVWGEAPGALPDLERRKPEIRHVAERSPAQEAARLQEAQAMAVARREQVGAVEVMRLLRHLLARGLFRPVLGDEIHEVARYLGAHALAHRPQRRMRPLAVALRQQREIEQPFAGIVDDPEGQARRASRDLGQELADRAGGREAQRNADLADIGGAVGPIRHVARHLLDIVEIGKARQPVRLRSFQLGGDQAALADR